MRHGDEVHARVIDGRRAEGHVARGELDGVAVDVEAAQHVLHQALVQGVVLPGAHFLLRGDARLDGPEGRHQQRPGPACGVEYPQFRDRFRIRPVDRVPGEGEAREHDRRDVVRIERAVALRRSEDAVVERPGVVVAEVAQRVGDAVGALGDDADRVGDRLALAQRREDREGGPEHRRIVLFEDRLPRDCEDFPRVLRARDPVEADDGLHLRLVAQAPLHEAGVADHERRDGANPLRAAVVLREEVEGRRERVLQVLFLEHGACAPDRVGDLVRDELAGPAESRSGGDMRVDSLFGLLQVEGALYPPALGFVRRAAARSPRSGPLRLLVDLDEIGGRFGEAAVMRLQRPQDPAHRPVALGAPLQRGRDVLARFDDDGNDDVAEALARRLPHDAPDGLDDVDLAVPGVEERHGVEPRHVDAFGEEFDVAEHPAFPVPVDAGEGPKLPVALEGARGRVEVLRGDLHRPPVLHPPGGGPQNLALRERAGVPLRARDAVGERHGARQLAGLLQGRALGDAVDRERNAEHPRHVVGGRGLLAPRRRVDPFEAPPQARRDARLVHAEHDHPVVGEHSVLHRFGERQPVELRAIDAVIAHVDDVDPVFGESASGAFGVDARGCGHVEALAGAQPRVVVDLLEVDLPGAARPDERARRPVGLVGDGQIERRGAVMRLRLGDPPQRMVRAEHGAGRACAVERAGDLGRVRRDRAFELGYPDVLVLVAPAGGRIGAHDDARQFARRLPQPFAPRLRHQRDGRRREEDPPSVRDGPFGDAKGGEGLAGAARHDEAAPVVVAESVDRVLDRLYLEGPRLLHRALGVALLDLDVEIFAEVDLRDLGVGVPDRPLRVRPPPARRHDPPQAEYLLLGAAEELVDLALAEGVPVVVALALDGDPFPRSAPRHEVDPDVAAVESGQRLAFGPVGPAPDVVDLEFGPLARDPHEQLLEPPPLLGLVAAVVADALEDDPRARPPPEVEIRLRARHGAAPRRASNPDAPPMAYARPSFTHSEAKPNSARISSGDSCG